MKRKPHGISLIEVLVSAVLVGFTLAAIGELIVLNTYASTKLMNSVDGQIGCARALRRVGEDIRQGRAIGNIYSDKQFNRFPDFDSGTDPSSIQPAVGFPVLPWPAVPYSLGPQTLIIQQPVFYEASNGSTSSLNGFPLRLAPGAVTSSPMLPPVASEYVDTVVYQVIPDPEPSSQGQYLLQVARFSGFPLVPGCKLREPINPPQTVLKGIVGPVDSANPIGPSIFQYLTSAQENQPITNPSSAQAKKVTGVSINVEVRMPASNTSVNQQATALHLEAFLKNSRLMRLTND